LDQVHEFALEYLEDGGGLVAGPESSPERCTGSARRLVAMIRLKRVYESAVGSDGYRVLVDRLWPRGLRKEEVQLNDWLKDVAPSAALRGWFGHDPGRFRGFCARYRRELRRPAAQRLLDDLAHRAARGTVTLIYSARDPQQNNAVVLAKHLARRIEDAGERRDR
jgi:uncharacterized protein YeaO (DUF488 family)